MSNCTTTRRAFFLPDIARTTTAHQLSPTLFIFNWIFSKKFQPRTRRNQGVQIWNPSLLPLCLNRSNQSIVLMRIKMNRCRAATLCFAIKIILGCFFSSLNVSTASPLTMPPFVKPSFTTGVVFHALTFMQYVQPVKAWRRRRRRTDRRCSAGMWGSHNVEGTPCTNCAAGKYSALTGQQTEATCQACPQGKYSQNAQSTCKDDCNTGVYIKSDKTACLTCIQGQYQNENDQSSCKDDCNVGSYINTDKTACLTCDQGQYQNENDQFSCKDNCNAGSYINTDKTACLTCIQGQYQNENDQSSCKPCGTGRYNGQQNQTSCKDDCNAGSSINVDKTACTACALGKYQNLDDQTGCKSNCVGWLALPRSIACLECLP